MTGAAAQNTAGRSMTSQPNTLAAFIDGASASVARVIAGLHRDAANERQLRDAQFAAKMAELDARLASVAETERRLSERMAAVRDGEPGRSVTVEEVTPLILAEVERRVAAIPAPKDGEPGKSVTVDDVAPMIAERVAEAVAAIELPDVGAMVRVAVAALPVPKNGIDGENGRDGTDGKDGASVTLDDLAPMVAEVVGRAVSAFPAPENGKDGADGRDGRDADMDAVRGMVTETVAAAVSAIPPAENGKDADPEFVRQMVREAFAELPPAKDGENGRSVTVDDVAPLIADQVRAAVEALPPPEKGERGPEGRLPVVQPWQDRVYYEGAVVSFDGGVFQAARDTGKAPGHEDWTCIVARGRDGEDGRSFTIRGTFDADAEYRALDVVALNGASFAARRDNPGECPGEGWQLIASQGRQGKPGERGASIKGDRGPAGPGLSELVVDGNGLLIARNGDGSEVECDLYPVLIKVQG